MRHRGRRSIKFVNSKIKVSLVYVKNKIKLKNTVASKALNHVEANNEIPTAIVPYTLWLMHRLTAAVNCRVI